MTIIGALVLIPLMIFIYWFVWLIKNIKIQTDRKKALNDNLDDIRNMSRPATMKK